MSSHQRVLITGVTGFLATHVVDQALKAGLAVRGTVRSQNKLQDVQKRWHGPAFEAVVIPDVATGDFSDALKDIDAVIHVASPFPRTFKDAKKEVLEPAIEGTLNVMRAARKSGVTRIVLTASIAGVLDPTKGGALRDYTYTPNDWNPFSYELAASGKLPEFAVYVASKKLSEKAAWDYVGEHPEMKLTAILPTMIPGPALQSVDLSAGVNASVMDYYDLINGSAKIVPPTAAPLWVDVRDAAQAHILALQNDAVIGKRIILNAGVYTFYRAVQIIKEKRPELASRLPSLEGAQDLSGPIAHVDTSIAVETLGMKFRTYEESLLDTIDSLIEHEKKARL